jgi:RNA polymerase primary sigma factor
MIVLKNDQKNSAVLKSNGNPYLKAIGLHPHLTREKQDELYAKLDALCPDRLANNKLDDIPDECKPLCWEIASYMLKLVISVARKYKDRAGKLTFDDLIQVGNIGLLRGVWCFDNDRGVRLSTYVTPWIWQAVGRAITIHGSTINMTYQSNKQYALACQFIDEYRGTNGISPSVDELASHLEISKKKAEIVLNLGNVTQITSLDEEHENQNGTSTSYDFLVIETDFDNDASLSELSDNVSLVLSQLSAREERIIRMRYGLVPSRRPMNLGEIGEKFGLTRERIRQIEVEALEKMRKPELLEEYV